MRSGFRSAIVASRLALSSTTLLDVPLSASACVRAKVVSASTRRASAAASSLLSSATRASSWSDAAALKGARLGGEPVVQGLEVVAPGDLDLVLALELIDEPVRSSSRPRSARGLTMPTSTAPG